MHLVLGSDAGVAAWVAQRIPQMQSDDPANAFGPCIGVGVASEDGKPLGGVVFHDWQPRFKTVQASFASDSHRWLTRRIIVGILSIPFDQWGCQRINALTPKRNKAARKFLDTFGFKREGACALGFGDDDAIISGLLKRDWIKSRWMVPPRHKPAIGLGCEDQTNGTPSLGDQRPGSLSDRIEGIVPNGQAGPHGTHAS